MALISFLLGLVGYGVVNQITQGPRNDQLLQSGAVAMRSDELIKHVKAEKIAAYWLGPLPGYTYTIICRDRKEIIITYLPQGVSLNQSNRFNLTVETYAKSLESEAQGVSSLSTDRDDFLTSNGTAGTVFSARPQRVTYGVPGTDKVVEIQYPDGRRIYDVSVDAQRLILISEAKP